MLAEPGVGEESIHEFRPPCIRWVVGELCNRLRGGRKTDQIEVKAAHLCGRGRRWGGCHPRAPEMTHDEFVDGRRPLEKPRATLDDRSARRVYDQ